MKEYNAPLVLEERPVPHPGPGEAVIRVRACGLCGTDLKIAAGRLPDTRVPVIMGHEAAGEVIAVGPGARGLRAGDRVVAHLYLTCGQCEHCRSGRETLCVHLAGRLGFQVDGGFAEYLRLPGECLLQLGESVDFAEGALLGDAVGTAFRALHRRARLAPGDTAVIIGVGGVGVHAVQVARAIGARPIAVDVTADRLAMAISCGADAGLLFSDRLEEELRELLGDQGAHVVLDTVGKPEVMEAAVRMVRPGGCLVAVGYHPGEFFRLDPTRVVLDELSIIGSRACTREDVRAVIRLVNRGLVRPVVTRRFPLEAVNEAMAELAANRIAGRAVVLPWPDG